MNGTRHIGHQVIAMMDRLGVSPLTRNYHLFYLCIANSDPALRKAVRNLGMLPTQPELDQVIAEFCPDAVDSQMLRRHENAVLCAIDELALRLQSEQSEMTGFHRAVERVAAALSRSADEDKVTTELLLRAVRAIEETSRLRAACSDRTLKHVDDNRREVTALRSELLAARKLANTDALTGLANRRSFDETLASTMGNGTEFALILIDIDHFKRINDAYGHTFGDHILRTVAVVARRALREGAFLARTGGEEFAIIVSKTTERDAISIAERVRQAIEQIAIRREEDQIGITISLGVALSRSAETPNRLYEAADVALYRAKNAGRNRVNFLDPLHDESSTNRYRIYAG
jgi:diguanylate cyclase